MCIVLFVLFLHLIYALLKSHKVMVLEISSCNKENVELYILVYVEAIGLFLNEFVSNSVFFVWP